MTCKRPAALWHSSVCRHRAALRNAQAVRNRLRFLELVDRVIQLRNWKQKVGRLTGWIVKHVVNYSCLSYERSIQQKQISDSVYFNMILYDSWFIACRDCTEANFSSPPNRHTVSASSYGTLAAFEQSLYRVYIESFFEDIRNQTQDLNARHLSLWSSVKVYSTANSRFDGADSALSKLPDITSLYFSK